LDTLVSWIIVAAANIRGWRAMAQAEVDSTAGPENREIEFSTQIATLFDGGQ
jgi:hypothetical protein